MRTTVVVRRRKRWPYIAAVCLVLAVYVAATLMRPLPALKPKIATNLQFHTSKSSLQWPPKGQAAVGVLGTDIADLHGEQQPAPIASVAKVITALVVLNKYPLKAGQTGPTLTITPADVAIYDSYAAQQGSVVKVTAGEKITQYQILQAMMLPSSNNLSDTLATWAFGSLPAYAKAADAFLQQHHLSGTTVGSDASGLAATTTSTAHDLLEIGELAMKQPVLAQIVAQPSADGIPVVNTVKNVNYLLGGNNIIGIKTGNTDQAGGVFLGASRSVINNKPVTIVSAVVGEDTLFNALKYSNLLLKSAQTNFETRTILKAGRPIATYQPPWGGNVKATVTSDFTAAVWKGNPVSIRTDVKYAKPGTKSGQPVGSILVTGSSSPDQKPLTIKLQQPISHPSIKWRLTHPI